MRSNEKNKRNGAIRTIAQAIINQYQPTSAEDMHDALRDIFGPMFEAMLQGEMDSHLGYESNNHGFKDTINRRNSYTHKKLRTSMGEVEIDAPRDRDGSFDPQLIPKCSKDVSGIEDKVLSMYAKGMSQRGIADTIKDIYGFEISHGTTSNSSKISLVSGLVRLKENTTGCRYLTKLRIVVLKISCF